MRTAEETKEQVLSIMRDTASYSVQVDYCHPERITEQDMSDIRESAEAFRKQCSIADIEEAIDGFENESPAMLASMTMNYNADHGIYQSISVYLTPIT
jgi:hypothetical protein